MSTLCWQRMYFSVFNFYRAHYVAFYLALIVENTFELSRTRQLYLRFLPFQLPPMYHWFNVIPTLKFEPGLLHAPPSRIWEKMVRTCSYCVLRRWEMRLIMIDPERSPLSYIRWTRWPHSLIFKRQYWPSRVTLDIDKIMTYCKSKSSTSDHDEMDDTSNYTFVVNINLDLQYDH
jgi:hypothetical protein